MNISMGSDSSDFSMIGNGVLSSSRDVHHARDQMVVPNRIIVAGGDEVVADKPPPHEITLDKHSFPPGQFSHGSMLEPPPEKLTLQNRPFPTIDEADFVQQQRIRNANHQRQQALSDDDKTPETINPERVNQSSDSLPSTTAMSALSPSDELVLLRNQVRKLNARLQKVEEELQNSNWHLALVEYFFGCGAIVFAVALSILWKRR